MPQEQQLTDLAGAVADGRPLDWASIEQSTPGPAGREAIAALRDVSQVGALFASLANTLGRSDQRPERLEPGASWGGFRIVEHVGSGRYGDVYRAWDAALDRHVALKLVGCDDSAKSATPVVDEGRLMARVRHPNVVAIYGAQRIGDVAGLSMEFVGGRTLEADLAARGPAGAEDLVRIGRDLAGALGAVHGAGLVHRDVKASIALVESSGRVVLGDFGTGQDLDVDASTGGLVGTPAYVAPEIFAGQPATPQSDVYSLGVLLFRLATGEYPQTAKTLRDLRDAHESVSARSLRDARPDLPPALAALVDRSLDRDPAKRFASGDEMARAFDAFRRPPAPKVSRALVALAAGLAIAVALLAWQSRPAPFQFNERDWVLVSAFDNNTSHPLSEDAVTYALELELGNSPVVNVVPRERVDDTLALMRLPLDTRLGPQAAREVALRDGGVRAIVAGQVDLMGEGYRLSAVVTNPVNGAIVATVTEPALGQADVLPALARLATGIRNALTEALPGLPPVSDLQVQRVTTSSLKAWTLYQKALPELRLTANPRLAEELLSEAVREDPDFAVAHVMLARAIFEQRLYGEPGRGIAPSTHRAEEIDSHLEAAARAAQHVSPEDRYRITAESAWLQRIRTEGEERTNYIRARFAALDALERLRPDDPSVLLLQLEQGDLERQDVPSLVERLSFLRPNSPHVLVLAAIRLWEVGEYELSRAYIDRARPIIDLPSAERAGDEPAVRGRWLLFDMAWLQDEIDEAKALADELTTIWRRSAPEPASAFAQQTARRLLALGQFDQAEKVAASSLRRDGSRELLFGSISFGRGNADSARELLDSNAIDPSFPSSWVFLQSFITAGRLDEARAAVALIRPNPRWSGGSRLPTEARLAMAEGRPEQAIALLEPLVNEQPNYPIVNDLADAFVMVGDISEAVRVLEVGAGLPREPLRSTVAHHYLAMLDRLARLYREVGRFADADVVDDRLRLLLRYADDDHPIKRRPDALDRGR